MPSVQASSSAVRSFIVHVATNGRAHDEFGHTCLLATIPLQLCSRVKPCQTLTPPPRTASPPQQHHHLHIATPSCIVQIAPGTHSESTTPGLAPLMLCGGCLWTALKCCIGFRCVHCCSALLCSALCCSALLQCGSALFMLAFGLGAPPHPGLTVCSTICGCVPFAVTVVCLLRPLDNLCSGVAGAGRKWQVHSDV